MTLTDVAHIQVQETAPGCSSVVTFFKVYFPLQATSYKGFSLERLRPIIVVYTPERTFRELQPHASGHEQDSPSFPMHTAPLSLWRLQRVR